MTTPLRGRVFRALRYVVLFAVLGCIGEVIHTMVLVSSQDGAQRSMLLDGPFVGWMIGAVLGGAIGWLERHRSTAAVGALAVLFLWPWLV